jgi:hypothetical protein
MARKRQTESDEALRTRLLTDYELAAKLGTGFTPRNIAELRRAGKIPHISLGYRFKRYDLNAVLAALSKREIKAIGS